MVSGFQDISSEDDPGDNVETFPTVNTSFDVDIDLTSEESSEETSDVVSPVVDGVMDDAAKPGKHLVGISCDRVFLKWMLYGITSKVYLNSLV